jgi:hypothetical protein
VSPATSKDRRDSRRTGVNDRARETYVLHEPFSSESQGKTLCFAGMTAIGPMASPDADEWVRFSSKEAALRSPAAYHSLTFYEPTLESELETANA